ncbi:hypothetical protein [Ilumatobacter sp.]|uniref:hypothetical protein n=1 Tax=Ilumatobacter sp. TaxID=1967498 RepID=UPI003752141C
MDQWGKCDGAECTGWAYIDDCSNAIADTTFMRTVNDAPAIAGAVPADVASVLIPPDGGRTTCQDLGDLTEPFPFDTMVTTSVPPAK